MSWEVKPTQGTQGEAIIAKAMAQRRRGRTAKLDPMKAIQNSFDAEDVQGVYDAQRISKTSWEPPWPHADLETRALKDCYGVLYDLDLRTTCTHSIFCAMTQNYLRMHSPLMNGSAISTNQRIYTLTGDCRGMEQRN